MTKNQHQSWLIDQSVIDFLWEKGWPCCQQESCDWWEFVNKHLKTDLFTSEQEWQDFKKQGLYPAKHQANWQKLTPSEQKQLIKQCQGKHRSQFCAEKLMTYTLKITVDNNKWLWFIGHVQDNIRSLYMFF